DARLEEVLRARDAAQPLDRQEQIAGVEERAVIGPARDDTGQARQSAEGAGRAAARLDIAAHLGREVEIGLARAAAFTARGFAVLGGSERDRVEVLAARAGAGEHAEEDPRGNAAPAAQRMRRHRLVYE